MTLLEVDDLRSGYGALPVLHGIDLAIGEGELAVMLGLNGAGKSTTLMTIAGQLRTWAGQIRFDGTQIHRLDTAARVALGIVLVPEGRRVFPDLSVQVNLRLGGWTRRRDRAGYSKRIDRVFSLFPWLAERRGQLAGTLSGGEQQMLAIARGLMADPRLLLIDEASLGLAPVIAQDLFRIAKEITRTGVPVLMVEQNAGALSLADRAFVMEKGMIAYSGPADELRAADLRSAYLGEAAAENGESSRRAGSSADRQRHATRRRAGKRDKA